MTDIIKSSDSPKAASSDAVVWRKAWMSEAPSLAIGDRIDIDGTSYTVQGEPVRDRERLIWTVELVPV